MATPGTRWLGDKPPQPAAPEPAAAAAVMAEARHPDLAAAPEPAAAAAVMLISKSPTTAAGCGASQAR